MRTRRHAPKLYLLNRQYSFSHDGEPFMGRLIEAGVVDSKRWLLIFQIGWDDYEFVDTELTGLGVVMNG